MHSFEWTNSVANDVRYGLRQLRRSPGFALVAILTLALGIGANTALLSIANGLFWSPPPGVRDADGLSWVSLVKHGEGIGVSYSDYLAFRDGTPTFGSLAAVSTIGVSLGGPEGDARRLGGELVSGNYFSVLRMRLALGRGFAPDEDRSPGTHPVAVISYDLWRSRFGSRGDILGSEVSVNGSRFTIVGVAAPGFRGLKDFVRPSDIWIPAAMYTQVMPEGRELLGLEYGLRSFYALGRLSEGVSPENAQARLATMVRQWASEFPDSYARLSASVAPFGGIAGPSSNLRGKLIAVLALAAAVTLTVLLITCGNIACLLLARAQSRTREIAIRAAVGASNARIARQLFVESLVLALLGGVVGAILAYGALSVFSKTAIVPFPIPIVFSPRVFGLTIGLCGFTALAFGIAPAVHAARRDLTRAMKGSHGDGTGGSRLQRLLVAGQLALSCMLLVSAGLLVRSSQNLLDAGSTVPARDQVLTAAFRLDGDSYTPEKRRAVQRELVARIEASPGVRSVTLAAVLPSESRLVEDRISVDGQKPRSESGRVPRVMIHKVWPAFFHTLDIPILRGRDFTFDDRAGGAPVVIINETAARLLWQGRDPLGRQLRLGPDTMAAATVIAVVADAPHDHPWGKVEPVAYLPDLQLISPSPAAALLIHTRGRALDFAPALRHLVNSVDPNLALFKVRSIRQVYDEERQPTRLGNQLLLSFGLLALVLAMIGLHGVVAYTVNQRSQEVGIRMALGADRLQILTLFVRDVFRFASAGVAIGLFLAAGAAQVLSSVVQRLDRTDALPFIAVAVLLLGVAILTGLLPARRATRVDPVVAIRSD